MAKKKVAAGKLFTHYLNEIGQEMTEVGEFDGQPVMISKIEKMCRNMWKYALGYEEEEEVKEGTRISVKRAPDKAMMVILYDRMEGKAAPAKELGSKKRVTAADKVTEESKKRIAAGGK